MAGHDYHSYKTQAVLANGPWLGADNLLQNQASGYERGVPDRLWGGDSFTWAIDCYEDATTGTKLDMGGGTAILYIGLDASGGTLTQIGTGVISGTGDYIVTYTVPSGSIPGACYGSACLLVSQVTSTGKQTTLLQRVTVERAYTAAGSSASTYADQATSTGLTAGKVYFWDVGLTPDAWALADLDTAMCQECELWLAISTMQLVSEGLYAAAISSADVGDPVYLSDDGAIVHAATSTPGEVRRCVGWQRTATHIRFSGHLYGTVVP